MKLLFSLLFVASLAAAESEWVKRGADGKLVYKTTPAGDRIMDFSHAGYMGGGVAIPDVPVKASLRPSGSDDTAAIQKALDEIKDGALLLEAGVFSCSSTINISK